MIFGRPWWHYAAFVASCWVSMALCEHVWDGFGVSFAIMTGALWVELRLDLPQHQGNAKING